MLQKLVIRNYAIIESLEVKPDAHLNTITGETGAGKSIILGALSLILGARADTSVLINKDEKCVAEAHFQVADNKAFRQLLEQEDIDFEPVAIIRREISAAGKSRAFVNDTPVTLPVLTKLTSMLVDLQQQFGHLALEDDNFQLDVIDAIAQSAHERDAYNVQYKEYRKLSASLAELQQQQLQWQKEADYNSFLLQELTDAGFRENEIEDAEKQLKQLLHAEKIINTLKAAQASLEDGEQPMVNEAKRTTQNLQSITDVFAEATPLQERMNSVWLELKDIAAELSALQDKVSLDEELVSKLQERVDIGYKLLKKHGLQDTNALLALQSTLQNAMDDNSALTDKIAALEKEQQLLLQQLQKGSDALSAKRAIAMPAFTRQINELLALVGMPNARIEIQIRKLATPALHGVDDVAFLLDANKSGQFLPIQKAASGGEMSRIMLCIKSLTAAAMQLPTLIFDEVDTGISGEAARQVGILLRKLAAHHQIICITHQPQVAAKGTSHFYVFKEEGKDGRINTQLKLLAQAERVDAIARMIGGEQPSKAAIDNAKELVEA